MTPFRSILLHFAKRSKKKYRDVAIKPHDRYHFHTGRPLAARLGYDTTAVDAMPDEAVESFAGVADPFSLRELRTGESVVDLGSGAGFDCFVAAGKVGAHGHVVGIDMTEEMLAKSRATAKAMGLENVEFREGILEKLPIEDGWADVVISNGVINLCADKQQVFWRNTSRAQAGRPSAIRRHRQWQAGPCICRSQHRSLDGLNCRWSAVCSLAKDDRG